MAASSTYLAAMLAEPSCPATTQARARHLKPGLSRCEPERAADHFDFSDWFNAWRIERGISDRDLQQLCGFKTVSNAKKKTTGDSPLNFIDIVRWPARVRNDLIASYLAWCGARDLRTSHR